ncbi:RYamide receptor-like [Stylophora pistillata]|uniref:RYamide receptor-like n=1 Tax=Stylophora pistillata TaxID=50429 RepID=UPI000C03AC03|nr:RYamide receptor-like [Stylophora pistillata]
MSANVTAVVNGTQTMSRCFNHEELRIVYMVAFCLVFVASLVGNTFIGIIVYKTKSLKKPINFFIVNMAISDLLYPIFMLPQDLASLFTSGSWLIRGPLGQALCKLVSFSINVSTLVSSQSLVLIAVDRFVAVIFPLRSPLFSSKQCRFFILATWIITMVTRWPILFFSEMVKYSDRLICTPERSSYFQNYTVAIIAVGFYVPLVLIAILYLTIALTIKSHKTLGEQSANTSEQRLKRERIVLKMSIAIVLAFAMCWLPLTIWWLVHFYLPDKTMRWSCGFRYFAEIARFLMYTYCAVNPCICFVYMGRYRQGLKNLLYGHTVL